ncbi:unnamed protein product [Cyberlindnera jadinii]|uniref:Uncharacterized protein n=1 Tax=Cyberlindnera jadinii (strain ATCC 18201 / CBS 1600 / BCRC 20928 / JCM 3617 / NBRC 0987 / NRRL Y-1542) TaxID=983966 RepID=A0A0H5CBM8_CYBJN|nr:unnamed protein product [Cyberlindnera jadinii]
MRKFPHHSTPLPLTPYVTMKKKKNSTIVVENEVVSEQDALKQSRDLSPSCFKQVDTTFHLNFDGNTLLNRRKMSGGFACGPKT